MHNETTYYKIIWVARRFFQTIKLLWVAGIDVNIQDEYGETALIREAAQGNFETVKLLLSDRRTDVNIQNKYGKTALIYAVKCNFSEVVKLLLSDGRTDVNIQDGYGKPALIYAIENTYFQITHLDDLININNSKIKDILELLLSRADIEVNGENNKYANYISDCINQGSLIYTSLLLADGRFNIDTMYAQEMDGMFTSYIWTKMRLINSGVDIFKLLIANGYNINRKILGDKTLFQIIEELTKNSVDYIEYMEYIDYINYMKYRDIMLNQLNLMRENIIDLIKKLKETGDNYISLGDQKSANWQISYDNALNYINQEEKELTYEQLNNIIKFLKYTINCHCYQIDTQTLIKTYTPIIDDLSSIIIQYNSTHVCVSKIGIPQPIVEMSKMIKANYLVFQNEKGGKNTDTCTIGKSIVNSFFKKILIWIKQLLNITGNVVPHTQSPLNQPLSASIQANNSALTTLQPLYMPLEHTAYNVRTQTITRTTVDTLEPGVIQAQAVHHHIY